MSDNAMVKRSLKNGDTITMSDREYRGKNPRYHVNPVSGVITKIAKGVPYVRTR